MAVFFMACHIIMMIQMEADSKPVYVEMCTIFALSSWVLIGRLAWDKFKKNL